MAEEGEERSSEIDRWAPIAARLVAELTPTFILHAGSASGALVEAFRNADVWAWGIDPSTPADAPGWLRPYLRAAPLSRPLWRGFDLVICDRDALGRLDRAEREASIANLCRQTNAILLVADDDPDRAPAPALAAHGFYRDSAYDAGYLGRGAALFRRAADAAEANADYERRLRGAEGEAQHLRAFVAAQEHTPLARARAWLRALWGERGRPAAATSAAGSPLAAPPAGPPPWRDPYPAWLEANRARPEVLASQRAASARLVAPPLISFLVPVFNPPTEVLREMVESVLAQTYGHWELCLADGASRDPRVRTMLVEYAARDARIRPIFLEQNRGISGNSNSALATARGEFVALLDHDDLIEPNLLFEVVAAIQDRPETDIVYFDEDKVSADGRTPREPWFKPHTFAPEHMLSGNPLMHSVARRALVLEVGAFDPETDGAQDWDLMLRCAERARRVTHIPLPLYHWRSLPNSAATDLAAKPWVIDLQPRVIAEHLRRIGLREVAYDFIAAGYFRFRWHTPATKVSVIIPTRDQPELLQRCVGSVLDRTEDVDYEILLIDTGTSDPRALAYQESLRAHEQRLRIITDAAVVAGASFNFSRACNLGARAATGELLLFLNNDTEILEPGWMAELVQWAARPDVGAVGAKLLYPSGRVQHAGVIVGMGHLFSDAPETYTSSLFGSVNWYRALTAVTAACMMIRREVFALVGGFDEGFEIAFGDVELCMRVRAAGYRNVFTPHARLRHHEGATRANTITPADQRMANRLIRPMVDAGDPYFNPNLDTSSKLPALRKTVLEEPPRGNGRADGIC